MSSHRPPTFYSSLTRATPTCELAFHNNDNVELNTLLTEVDLGLITASISSSTFAQVSRRDPLLKQVYSGSQTGAFRGRESVQDVRVIYSSVVGVQGRKLNVQLK